MFCLPRPRPRVGRQCSRWRVLLRPPRFASALPPVPTLDPQRRHCPWHLWFPPARPPPHPPRRLPPRPGPGAERPERVGQNFRKKRTFQGYNPEIPFRAQSQTGNRSRSNMPPPTGSEALQGPPDTGRRPLSFQDPTGPWSHNMSRTGSKEPDRLRAILRILKKVVFFPSPRQLFGGPAGGGLATPPTKTKTKDYLLLTTSL